LKLIRGGIGAGAKTALNEAGIKLYGGVLEMQIPSIKKESFIDWILF
jgi:predicted Fe-Mo cluster-binding NifX family protein